MPSLHVAGLDLDFEMSPQLFDSHLRVREVMVRPSMSSAIINDHQGGLKGDLWKCIFHPPCRTLESLSLQTLVLEGKRRYAVLPRDAGRWASLTHRRSTDYAVDDF